MKVLGWFHGYPPVHNAGSEFAVHAVMKWLAGRGHEVVVGCTWPKSSLPGWLDGVEVRTDAALPRREMFSWADIAVTHLDLTTEAVQWARATDTPLAHYLHFNWQVTVWDIPPSGVQLAIANSQWVADAVQLDCPTTVVYPPVELDQYALPDHARSPRDITLINLAENKGAHLFWQLARAEPERSFLGVRGAYGPQVIRRRVPNVEVLANGPDMRDRVYARTRIVVMPSEYESWGRVAIEAMSSGIPVIAHPTPGLAESLGDAGIFVDRDDLDGYRDALAALDDPEAYAEAARKGRRRAAELADAAEDQLLLLEEQMTSVVASWNAVPPPDPETVLAVGPHGDPAAMRSSVYEQRFRGLGWIALTDDDDRTTGLRHRLRRGVVAHHPDHGSLVTTPQCYADLLRPTGWRTEPALN